MKKNFIFLGLSVLILSTYASADGLKNSLTNMMSADEPVSMVDLGNINLNAKPKVQPLKKKKRGKSATVAWVNKHKILKKEADVYLSKRTKGKLKDMDSLPLKQQNRLIHEMALPYLAMDAAKKELSSIEKETILTRAWIQKEAQKVKISEDEVQTVYRQMKQKSLDQNSTEPIPTFETVKVQLRSQMIEKKIISNVMKDVKIKISE